MWPKFELGIFQKANLDRYRTPDRVVSDNILTIYLIKATNNSTVTLLFLSFSLDYSTTLSNTSPSKVMLVVNNKLGRARKKTAMAYFRPCPNAFLYTLKAATESFNQGSRCCSRRSKQVLPKYKFSVLPLHKNFRLLSCHYNEVFEQKPYVHTFPFHGFLYYISTDAIAVVDSLLEDLVCDRGQVTWFFILKILELLIRIGWSSCKVLLITSNSFYIFAFTED